MPKIKSHSGAKKRFFRTARGKWKFKKSGLQHMLTPMSAKTGRHLRKAAVMTPVDGEKIRKLLPYH